MKKEENCICPNCMKYVVATPTLWTDNLIVRNENIEVKSMVLVCNTCKGTFNNKKYPADVARMAFDIYRQNHNMMKTEDFTRMRKEANLSIKQLAKMLNWEEQTLKFYEGGALQSTEDESEFIEFFKTYNKS